MSTNILVLLSTYNGEKFLDKLLSSLCNIKNVNLSILIRDDGSTDKTLEILNLYSDRLNFNLLLGNRTHLGAANSYRFLIEYARDHQKFFDWYAFCDQDDIWHPERFKKLSEFDSKLPTIVTGSCVLINENDTAIGLPRKVRNRKRSLLECLIVNNNIGCCSIINFSCLNELYNAYVNLDVEILHDKLAGIVSSLKGRNIFIEDIWTYYRQHNHNDTGYELSLYRRIKTSLRRLPFSGQISIFKNYLEQMLESNIECNFSFNEIADLINSEISTLAKIRYLVRYKVRRQTFMESIWLYFTYIKKYKK